MAQVWQHLGAACLLGLGCLCSNSITMVLAHCQTTSLTNGECWSANSAGVPLSLLQHRAHEQIRAAGEEVTYSYVGNAHQYMNLTKVVQNNLGGKGPDTGAKELRYQNVFPNLATGSIDLVVTTLTSYNPKVAAKNGVEGAVGSINFRGGKSTKFLFKFVDTFNASRAVILDKLFFSYYDIDNDKQELREEISTPNFEKAFLTNDTTIEVIPRNGATPPIFRSTAIDNSGFNNPDDPSNLTPEQRRHSVTFSFTKVSQFEVTFATPNGTSGSGRNFFFSGAPLFPDCINETGSEFMNITDVAYSNIGGDGPDKFAPEGMRLKKVFDLKNGTFLDLIVKTIDAPGFEYVPALTDLNGARDGFGSINMQLGAKAKFGFKFVDSMTNASFTLKDLYFAWLDMDGHPHAKLQSFQEKVIMGGPLGAFGKIWLSNDTEVLVTPKSDGTTEFASSEVDDTGGDTNPSDPTFLTPEQENRAFAVEFGSVSSFYAIIDLSSGRRKMPRSLYFQAMRMIKEDKPDYCV